MTDQEKDALIKELLSLLKAAVTRIEAFDRQIGDVDLIADIRAVIQKERGEDV